MITKETTPSVRAQAKPTVSVIIPAYNVERFIVQAIDSVLNQTISELEIIVVNDGSEDGTNKAVEQFDDVRIRMIFKENGGCASARNAGVKIARGNFISFLDGDDYWLPDKLERELAWFESHPHADLVFSLSLAVNEEGDNLGILKTGKHRSFSFEDLLIENPVGNGSSVLIKKEALDQTGPFDESLPASSDCDMWLRIAKLHHNNFICLPKVLTCYRRRRFQTTGDYRRMAKAYELVLEKARLIDPEVIQQTERLSRCNASRYHAFIAYETGDLKVARALLMKSFIAAPGPFILKQRSWLLAFGITSKSCLPERFHSALGASYIYLRKAFCKKLGSHVTCY